MYITNTTELRWLQRDAETVLQQKWYNQTTGEYFWEDVPLIIE